jgi:hypothetical protein
MGGTNDKSNIVALTAREHFIAHALLAKVYGGKQWAAFSLMRGKADVSSCTYEIVRRAAAISISKHRTGMKFSESHKQNLRYKKSPEHVEKIAASKRGKKAPPKSLLTNAKIGASHKGKNVTLETRKKMRASAIAAHAKRSDKNNVIASAKNAANARWDRVRFEKQKKEFEFLAILAGVVAASNTLQSSETSVGL